MGNCNKDCKKDCCKKDHNKKDHNKKCDCCCTPGSNQKCLLKYFDFVENITPNVSPSTLLPILIETEIARITLKEIHTDDRINLKAKVDWNIDLSGTININTFGAVPATRIDMNVPLFHIHSIIFKLWRDAIGSGTLVCQTNDFRSNILDARVTITPTATLPIPFVSTITATTSASCTDINAPKGAHTYFLTATAQVGFTFNTQIVPVTVNAAGTSTTLASVSPSVTTNTSIGSAYLDGSVIDENGTKLCK
ncbi:hypothetical protein [Paenibacillus spongiae]|uniref:DUF3794 domain-containing protein n=1 Tax=Paenibacillus spongiae TaxID=2909671 RepID=A0ABY5S0G6_9BACL|nr:hypothetical protein [Paenibacillus spongiae]UVI27341.1 hypothetical protein L1F29_17845 [Paenibacillus spongiae]